MSTKSPQVGGEVDSWCTKCLMMLNHRIVALMHNKPVKAECLTCRSVHMYRAQAPGAKRADGAKREGKSEGAVKKAPGARGTRGAAATKAAAVRLEQEATWEKAIAGSKVTDFKQYRVGLEFAERELIRHKKFGDGVVTRVIDAHKVEVLFQDIPRTLAQALAD